MGKTYYTYEGKKKALGGISKMFNDLVLIDDDWVGAVNDHFKSKGYDYWIKSVKTILRTELSIELTDAQAWLLMHHITNEGVPLPLRDEETDEDATMATYTTKLAGSVVGAVMTPVDLAYQGVTSVGKKVLPTKDSSIDDSTSPE
mgnify:CR=1 FL=1|jgi:hypothetical protein